MTRLVTEWSGTSSADDFSDVVEKPAPHKFRKSIRPLPLIAVGGIRSADDARRALGSGATLVEWYTALVRQDPSRIRRVISELRTPVGIEIAMTPRPGGR